MATGDLVEGYEIHMGRTRLLEGVEPFLKLTWRGRESIEEFDGGIREDGQIFGTYLHGLFDRVSFRVKFINKLRALKGLSPLKEEGQLSQFQVWEKSFEGLADLVEESLDLDYISGLLSL